MVYLQGGPSHLDLWDPKEPDTVPDNVRSEFKNITKIPGVNFTDIIPRERRSTTSLRPFDR